MLGRYDDECYMNGFLPTLPPFRVILNYTSDASCKRLAKEFIGPYQHRDDARNIKVVKGKTIVVAQSANFVMLVHKPYMVHNILSQSGMREALHGKLLISICAGVPNEDLKKAVYGNYDPRDNDRCRCVRVMPNTAAKINESMKVMATPSKPLSEEGMELVEFLFGCIRQVVKLASDKMDTATTLTGTGPAFYLMLESMTDGAVAMGIPRKEAKLMVAQTMKGRALRWVW